MSDIGKLPMRIEFRPDKNGMIAIYVQKGEDWDLALVPRDEFYRLLHDHGMGGCAVSYLADVIASQLMRCRDADYHGVDRKLKEEKEELERMTHG